ncbi:MAG: hypothetical protein ACPHVR_06685, partial [Poseidonia sp.]
AANSGDSADSGNSTFVADHVEVILRDGHTYGNLYGRMTDAEIKSIRIERDLSDPARLLNDLADDGLDFSAILGERAPVAAAATASAGTPAGVASEPIIPDEHEKEPATDLAFEAEEVIEEEVGDDV